MKKFYILIFSFLCILGFSQSYSTLVPSVNWKIVKIQLNNVDHYAPFPFLNAGELNFESTQNLLSSKFYNSTMGNFTFGENNANYFTLQNITSTLAVYYGENEQAVQQFDGMTNTFYSIFKPTDKFFFDYQEVLSGKNLVVTNPNGNKIFYSNQILSTQEISKYKISVYPNPATDIIIIENLKPNSSIELIDNSGKLVKSIYDTKISKTEISIKNLSSGIYYLKVDGQSVQKVIKK